MQVIMSVHVTHQPCTLCRRATSLLHPCLHVSFQKSVFAVIFPGQHRHGRKPGWLQLVAVHTAHVCAILLSKAHSRKLVTMATAATALHQFWEADIDWATADGIIPTLHRHRGLHVMSFLASAADKHILTIHSGVISNQV